MLEKDVYANGQKAFAIAGDRLTYYFKDGTVKAFGEYRDGKMEGEWIFHREGGALWQVGHFTGGRKSGRWIRYSRDGAIEYDQEFRDDKPVKKGKA